MKTSRWLTLSAAIVITVLEAWLFAGASAVASQNAVPSPVMKVTVITPDAP